MFVFPVLFVLPVLLVVSMIVLMLVVLVVGQDGACNTKPAEPH
jgi:hypothetical protein